MTIQRQSRGELTLEEERALRDPANWDPSRDEVFPGSPDARVVFHVEFDHAMMVALDAIYARDKVNPVDLIQRYVEERIAAEYASIAADSSNYAESA